MRPNKSVRTMISAKPMALSVSRLKKLNKEGTNSRKSNELISGTETRPKKSIKNESISRKTKSDTITRNRFSILKNMVLLFYDNTPDFIIELTCCCQQTEIQLGNTTIGQFN